MRHQVETKNVKNKMNGFYSTKNTVLCNNVAQHVMIQVSIHLGCRVYFKWYWFGPH